MINSPDPTPLVNIIIPTYNRRELLPEAMASCLNQTYPNIEVIIMDDGSTDSTRERVIEKLRAGSSEHGERSGEWAGKVVYHHKANGGASSAKNAGLKLARGEYIQFLDSDDVLHPEKISRQMAAIQAAGGIVDCCVCYGRNGFRAAGWEAAQRIGELCPDVATFIQRQCERTVHIMHTEAPLWRREFLLAHNSWREDLNVAEEWEYYIRLLTKQPRLASVAEDLFFIRAHEGDQLSKNFQTLRHSMSFYQAIRAVQELLEPTPFWIPESRAGLLLRARTTYVNLLRSADAGVIREYEAWLLLLAQSVPSRGVVMAIRFRQIIGRKLFLALFDLRNRKAQSSL